MAIDTVNPFTREQWNEDIIQEVNNLCENPDEGCDPLPPIEKAEADHIWTKEDVTEVQDKLKEICPENEFPEMETPQLWSKPQIIDPIQEAIDRGWCNCEPEYNDYDLGYFPQVTLEAGSSPNNSSPTVVVIPWACGGNHTTTYTSTWYPAPDNTAQLTMVYEANSAIGEAKWFYKLTSWAIFLLEDQIEVLEGEIDVLEGRITEIEDEELPILEAQLEELIATRDYYCTEYPGGAQCTNYTAAVTIKENEISELEDELAEKQEELEEKETELEEKEDQLEDTLAERQEWREIWDGSAAAQFAALKGMTIQFPSDIQPINLFPDMSEPWGDYWEDTRNWKMSTWTFFGDKFANDTADIILRGHFSPGGYPHYTGSNYSQLTEIKRTCKFFAWNRFDDCLCPWEVPYQPCTSDGIIWWMAPMSLGLAGPDCAPIQEQDWHLYFQVIPAVDYIRPD